VREEFDKATKARQDGNNKLAAFYAGAMAHYLGDLSQFCHIMGEESHWGKEDLPGVHTPYESAVEIDFETRTSSLLDSFIHKIPVGGDTPEEIARSTWDCVL